MTPLQSIDAGVGHSRSGSSSSVAVLEVVAAHEVVAVLEVVQVAVVLTEVAIVLW